jgi:uncharacterized protein related to proFAR isomerase
MNIIPLIEINNKKIQNSEWLEKINEDELIYIIDLDGIKKDESNLDIYQKLSKKYQLIIDNAPRSLGDIIDVFMAGAKSITLRKTFYPHLKIERLREITENKIYANIEIYDQTEFYNDLFLEEVNGLINFYSRKKLEKDFKKMELIKNLSKKNKTYIYENNKNNIDYWNKFKPECYLVEISKYLEFKKI